MDASLPLGGSFADCHQCVSFIKLWNLEFLEFLIAFQTAKKSSVLDLGPSIFAYMIIHSFRWASLKSPKTLLKFIHPHHKDKLPGKPHGHNALP